MIIYRDRAFCARSRFEAPTGMSAFCANTTCDRYADAKVREMAAKAKFPIGWADLKTSKCGFVGDEEVG